MVAKGEGVGGGMEWEAGISRCELLMKDSYMRRVEIDGRSRKVVFIFIFIMKFGINEES